MANKDRKGICQYDFSDSESDDKEIDNGKKSTDAFRAAEDLPMAYRNRQSKDEVSRPRRSPGAKQRPQQNDESSDDDFQEKHAGKKLHPVEDDRSSRRRRGHEDGDSPRRREVGQSRDYHQRKHDKNDRRSRSPESRHRAGRDGRDRSSGRRRSRDRDFRHSRDDRPFRRRTDRNWNYQDAQASSSKVAEQIEKRKLLWRGGKEKTVAQSWETMLAACTDEKQAEKLKRMIGLREDPQASTSLEGKTDNEARRQEEIARNLQQQYDSARMSTHTHRGMGLGFTSQFHALLGAANDHAADDNTK